MPELDSVYPVDQLVRSIPEMILKEQISRLDARQLCAIAPDFAKIGGKAESANGALTCSMAHEV